MDLKKETIELSINKLIKGILCFCIITFLNLSAFSQNQTPQEYITKWKNVAIKQMQLHQIPASITLAQGILESGSGNSKLASLANNHFGIKCHSSWTGETYYQDDDEKDECFRKYKNAMQSFEDHSDFLKKRRYEPLFKLKITDYKGWAKGLKKAGYATNPKYPDLLISLIERYKLDLYDDKDYSEPIIDIAKNEDTATRKPKEEVETISYSIKHKIYNTANLVPFIIIKKGDNYKKIEKELGIRKWQITKYNDLPKSHDLVVGERIFIKPKRCKSKEKFHIVSNGQTLRDISQLYGVKLKKLYKRNRLDEGSIPKAGQKINLRKKIK
ncbi:glucosaminidase domain-containing protein [Flavobacteriales bacterium]|nr:glucosaminidase domain-containing protein [Flavobacteriales bacterium]